MDGRRKLAEAFGAWADRHGYTQSQIAAMGGPSTTTQTKVRMGDEPVSRHTLRQLEAVMGWPKGSAAAVLKGEAPPLVDPDSVDVGGGGNTGGSLLVLRPDGLTDEEWDVIVEDSRGYLEWLVQKAAKKRRD